MTIKEFIKNEKENVKSVGFFLEMKMEDLQKTNITYYEYERAKILGFIEGLYYSEYISEELYDSLFKDFQKLSSEIHFKLLNIC